MCISVPARVLEVMEDGVLVDINGNKRTATSPIQVKKGDYVVLGMGVVLEKASEEEFKHLSSVCACFKD